MSIRSCTSLAFLIWALPLGAQQEHVFRGGVSVVRVDVQVKVESDAVGNLGRDDFLLKEHGKAQTIRYFAQEEQTLDVLVLLDVSVSMGPHVSRMVDTAHSALGVLRPGDRVGIMVFDRKARLRSPFNANLAEVRDALDETLHQESFGAGTDIHYGLFEAAKYVRKNARPEARRAIIILTDDQTEMTRKDNLILRGLWQADAILCSLIVKSEFRYSRTESANVAGLSKQTGGDSLQSADAAVELQATLERVRQRYTLGFHVPQGLRPGSARKITVELAGGARQKYPGALIQARRGYVVPDHSDHLAAVPKVHEP